MIRHVTYTQSSKISYRARLHRTTCHTENHVNSCHQRRFWLIDEANASFSIVHHTFRLSPGSHISQNNAIAMIENCVAEVRAWLIADRLMINGTKTEFLIIDTRHQLANMSVDSIDVGDSVIKPLESVRNITYELRFRKILHLLQ